MTFATDDFRPRFATGFLTAKEKRRPEAAFFRACVALSIQVNHFMR